MWSFAAIVLKILYGSDSLTIWAERAGDRVCGRALCGCDIRLDMTAIRILALAAIRILALAAIRILALALLPALGPTSAADTATLDYTFFKERVQPIFLAKRAGHARCVTCHSHGAPPLQPLVAGAESWNEAQSRANYAVWKQFVMPR